MYLKREKALLLEEELENEKRANIEEKLLLERSSENF